MIQLSNSSQSIGGEITLDGSKSISNRILIMQMLSGKIFDNPGISNSVDTQTLQNLLHSDEKILDAGAAGTTFRFLTSYLALATGKPVILTGSPRMLERPIGPLVDALNYLGAKIEYVNKLGFPPLRISPTPSWIHHQVSVAANMSSQYLSSLMLIAPYLPKGLTLKLQKGLVSKPYLEMTLQLMKNYGVDYRWKDQVIQINPGSYEQKPWCIEADWSAASYYFSMVALAKQAEIKLNGLFSNSTQGDSILPNMMESLGVQTEIQDSGIVLTKSETGPRSFFSWDFIRCPDLAQTVVVCCAGLGIPAEFTGLQTLYIKETDRVAALQKELQKVNVRFYKTATVNTNEVLAVKGQSDFVNRTPVFSTYEDHRMAMAFAPLALLHPIRIEDPSVVKKSYPAFWQDCAKIGFEVEHV